MNGLLKYLGIRSGRSSPAAPARSGRSGSASSCRTSVVSTFLRPRPEHVYYYKAPAWVPDVKVSHCSDCRTSFDFLRRKHHCRRCGEIFCDSCSRAHLPLRRLGFNNETVRHCKKCAEFSRKERDFSAQHLPVLEKGAPFMVRKENVLYRPSSYKPAFLYVTSDLKWIAFDYPAQSSDGTVTNDDDHALLDAIEITQITGINLVSHTLEAPGGALTIPGIQIRYYDSRGDLAEIRIVTKQGANSALERGVTWLIGVQAACRLLQETGIYGYLKPK